MNAGTEKKDALIKYLKRRGWMDLPFAHSSTYAPLDEEIADILDVFYSFHRNENTITPTGLGGGYLSEKKIFMISYRNQGWEADEKEYYDTISRDDNGYQIVTHHTFLRDVGPDFAPDSGTFQKLITLNRLCTRYGNMYIDAIPADDRDFFEWYVRIAISRIPKVDEKLFRQSTVAEFCSFCIMKDLFRLAYLTYQDDLIMEEWDRQRTLPPEKYQDRMFLEVFKKLGLEDMVLVVLNDLWERSETWALFRLLDRIKKGFIVGRKGQSSIPLIEARLLSLGETISGEWDRAQMAKLLDLSEGTFPKKLFLPDETA